LQTQTRKKVEIPDELRAIWRPPAEISIADWVESNIYLSQKMTNEAGLLRISRTPYIRGPLTALGNVFIEEVIVVWGRQLGKSTGVQYSFLCYCIAQDPGPATFLLPIRDKALEISETKLQPMFEACEEVRRRKPSNPDSYTKTRMDFTTMVLAMGWGGSESQTTTRSNRYLFIDEADEIKKSVGQNAIDPIKGIMQTTTTFPNRKIVMTSTPTTPEGNIWQGLKTCQYVFEYWIPCPHCGVYQVLYWENVRFGDDHDPVVVEEMAWYECEACHERISNLDKIRMLTKGEWRARTTPDPCDQIMKYIRARIEDTLMLEQVMENKRVKKIGFHLPKWYSPFSGGTFGVIAKEFLEADQSMRDGQDFAPMRNWRIYNAAIPWEQVWISETESDLEKNKVNLAPMVCPQGTIALTAGIDPGQGGFWYVILAWKRDYGAHLVYYDWLAGNYETSGLEEMIKEWTFEVEQENRSLKIWRTGIDTGGSQYSHVEMTMTEAAYLWIRKMRHPNLFGTKGLSRETVRRIKETRLDKMPGDKGGTIPGGLVLIEINTSAMKDDMWFHIRLNRLECTLCQEITIIPAESLEKPPFKCHKCGNVIREKPISGCFTFNNAVEDEYYRHLLAEQYKQQKDGTWEWINISKINHLLDCTIIAFSMADSEFRNGIRLLRGAPKPPSQAPTGPPVNPITRRPRGNWVKGW